MMVILATVESLLNVAAKWRGIDVIEKIQATDNIVIFPQGAPSFVSSSKGVEFANDNGPAGAFEQKVTVLN